jgi:hypothetical protein
MHDNRPKGPPGPFLHLLQREPDGLPHEG